MASPPERRGAIEDRPIDWRRTAAGVELYEAGSPEAWIHVDFEAGVAPDRRLFMICPDCGAVSAHRTKPGGASQCGDCGATFDHERSEDGSGSRAEDGSGSRAEE